MAEGLSRAMLTRRDLLRAGGATAAAGAATALLPPGLLTALAAPASCGTLRDIEHVVILIQENRSFDHYFGTYRGVRGFGDPHVLRQRDGRSVFEQPGYAPGRNPDGHLLPFHLDTSDLSRNAECTNDITHEWGAQHRSWDGGAMDSFVRAHLADDAANGPLTMGYYTRDDLRYYHALAEAFTLCDGYYCSVIGPTDPNRLYSMSATLGPDGSHGGPILKTSVADRPKLFGTLTWTTMPEQLEARGITWKVYGNPDGNYGDNVLAYFRNYMSGAQAPTLAAKAFLPSFPGTFEADVASGSLPQVSWVIAPLILSEHPPASPKQGEQFVTDAVLQTLLANPGIWAKTALFVTYDENGGFFDHVPPPTPAAGTPGEYVTVASLPPEAEGIRGPIGLGFRVPLLVVSPFSRGGLVSSDTFDHTSLLRFLETRFGAEVPNLTAWRRSVTGDLTAAFDFSAPGDTSRPALPSPALSPQEQAEVAAECKFAVVSEGSNGKANPLVPVYPVPANSMPVQDPGSRRRPSGVSGPACTVAAAAATPTSSPAGIGIPNTSSGSGAAWPGGVLAGAAVAAASWAIRRRRAAAGGGEAAAVAGPEAGPPV